MNEIHIEKISKELSLAPQHVVATAQLLQEGATVPFIARYRKEATGLLDEVAITDIRDRLKQLEELDKRRGTIIKSLEERDLLTEELEEKILAAETLTTLEDIYLPFRPKRRTRATKAREKGLEPLAVTIFEQDEKTDPAKEAESFVDAEKGVDSVDEALAGARDIMAEWINENQQARQLLRAFYGKKGGFRTKIIPGREKEGAKYRDYFDWKEPVESAPSHRILAMRRGEQEVFLNLKVVVPEEEAISKLETVFVKGDSPAAQEVRSAVLDAYKRLLSNSMATEIRLDTKVRADKEAINIFAENLRELLLAPPLGQRNVLAIDPGMRTGCKIVCMDRQGKFLHADTIYLFSSDKARKKAAAVLEKLTQDFQVEAIAIGNGTGGRETMAFVKSLEGSLVPQGMPLVMVNESGASVYSASKVARDEFPDLDVSLRGAVSIGRRLMDPLAELVKIDPKSIGVGQYQHDVDQQALKTSLDDVVVSCVNAVGVDVNTASEQLLTYVSGFGPQLAKQTVIYRNDHGPFACRDDFLKVPRLGPKAFEQAAGFLRIRGGKNPLDGSAVHPESYPIVESMAEDLGCSVDVLIGNEKLSRDIDLSRYVSDTVGMPTLTDIVGELAKPGRDPRKQFEAFSFAEGIEKMEDLAPGIRIPGIVTNVAAFGAFVDIGVHQDGLVHISELADRYIKDPHAVVKVHQKVHVTVLDVDLERRRISLSMRENRPKADRTKKKDHNRPQKGNTVSKKQQSGKKNNPFFDALKDVSI